MRNLNATPLLEHKNLIDLLQSSAIFKRNDYFKIKDYGSSLIRFTDITKKYLVELPSSQQFNNVVVEQFDYDYLAFTLKPVLMSVDVKKIVGCAGYHNKLENNPSITWSEILLTILKRSTIYHLIETSIKTNMPWHEFFDARINFIKVYDKYYFDSGDGLHRSVLAKYILSHNKVSALHNVNVLLPK